MDDYGGLCKVRAMTMCINYTCSSGPSTDIFNYYLTYLLYTQKIFFNSSYLTQYLSIHNANWTADIRNYIHRTIEPSVATWGWSKCNVMAVKKHKPVMQFFDSLPMDSCSTHHISLNICPFPMQLDCRYQELYPQED
jgi:hypothetical protein